MSYQSTKIIELGSCAFRQWRANHSHCKFLHGYQLKAKLWFGASSLDDKNWCVDFGGLKELKSKLQHVFDHTTTVAADDPELATFEELDRKGIIQLRVLDRGVGVERVAEIVYSIAQSHIDSLTNGRCWVDAVEVFEHEENSAIYRPETQLIQSTQETMLDSITVSPAPLPVEQSTPSRGANVGNTVTQGMGNPFAGTSWG
jgi:6-pyruvoyltetrahydropterin/6-carboxytetrahydropterin synthase